MTPAVLNWLVGGFLAFVSAMLYAILRGNLVPKATVDARLKDKDDQIRNTAELATMWEASSRKKDEVINQLAPAVEEMVSVNKTTMRMIEAMSSVKEIGGST